jgi:hypothetical protein
MRVLINRHLFSKRIRPRMLQSVANFLILPQQSGTGYKTEESSFSTRQRLKCSLLQNVHINSVVIQTLLWVPWDIPLGGKSGQSPDISPPSSPEIANEWKYISVPSYAFMTCTTMKQHCLRHTKNVKVKQSHYGPGQAQRVPGRLRLPDFKTIGTWRW